MSTTTTDDLTAPLGVSRDTARPASHGYALKAVAGLAAAGVAGLVGYAAWFGDPLGGRPYSRVEIGRASPPAPSTEAGSSAPATGSNGAAPGIGSGARQGADAVEAASGVLVFRPKGTVAPESVIVRIPDEDGGGRLRPAPDSRLVEQTRYGPLPRIGPDGARSFDVYARPAGELPGGARPMGRIAIVVGGLGISRTTTADAIAKLPGPVSLAFAPYGNELDRLVTSARNGGHEILLQVPMEPFDYPDSDPGPHTLITAAKLSENIDHLHWVLGRITGYIGLVNYMGGKFTADERALAPIVKEAGTRGLAVLDDGTSSRSVLSRLGGEAPAGRADVVIDATPRADLIDKALAKLEAIATAEGVAIGSASALPVTLERISRWAGALESRGVLLVPVSAAMRAPSAGRAAASR